MLSSFQFLLLLFPLSLWSVISPPYKLFFPWIDPSFKQQAVSGDSTIVCTRQIWLGPTIWFGRPAQDFGRLFSPLLLNHSPAPPFSRVDEILSVCAAPHPTKHSDGLTDSLTHGLLFNPSRCIRNSWWCQTGRNVQLACVVFLFSLGLLKDTLTFLQDKRSENGDASLFDRGGVGSWCSPMQP